MLERANESAPLTQKDVNYVGYVHTTSGCPQLGFDQTCHDLSDPDHPDNQTAIAAGWDLKYRRLMTEDEYHEAQASYEGLTMEEYEKRNKTSKRAATGT